MSSVKSFEIVFSVLTQLQIFNLIQIDLNVICIMLNWSKHASQSEITNFLWINTTYNFFLFFFFLSNPACNTNLLRTQIYISSSKSLITRLYCIFICEAVYTCTSQISTLRIICKLFFWNIDRYEFLDCLQIIRSPLVSAKSFWQNCWTLSYSTRPSADCLFKSCTCSLKSWTGRMQYITGNTRDNWSINWAYIRNFFYCLHADWLIT